MADLPDPAHSKEPQTGDKGLSRTSRRGSCRSSRGVLDLDGRYGTDARVFPKIERLPCRRRAPEHACRVVKQGFSQPGPLPRLGVQCSDNDRLSELTSGVTLASAIVPSAQVSPAPVSDSAKAFAAAASSENTKQAYRADWEAFTAWCELRERTPLPADPEALADFIATMAVDGYKPSTINRRVSAIAREPIVWRAIPTALTGIARETMAGVRRTLGVAPRQVAPVTVPELRAMVNGLPAASEGARDQALLLVGFAGALRRSELVGLDVADPVQMDAGTLLTLRRSKTDQEGEGRQVGIPYGS